MPTNFDGAQHFAGAPLANERAYAANQKAVPEVLSALLNESYCHLREQSRCFALRSWREDATALFGSGLLTLTTVREAWLPPHATSLVVAVRHGFESVATVRGFHDLRIVGGSGNIDTATVEGADSSARTSVSPLLDIPVVLDSYLYLPFTDAQLTAITADRTSLTLRLRAYASDSTGAAADYRPMSAAFYWLSEY